MEKYNATEIGVRIRNIRKSLGMTTDEFSKLFDPPASKGTISKWENGRYLPNNKRLKKIAELGNISVNYLLHGEEDFLNLSEDEQKRILNDRSNFLSDYENNSIDNLLYFLSNYSDSKHFRESVFLLNTTLRYSNIHETKNNDDPKLIRILENVISTINEYSTNDKKLEQYTDKQIRKNIIEKIELILDNAKKKNN